MSPIAIVGWSAVGALFVLWLVISFSRASPRRVVLEWTAATFLYVALSMLFLNLVLRARESGNTLALVAFGLLLALFASGFVVALVNACRALARPGSEPRTTAATN